MIEFVTNPHLFQFQITIRQQFDRGVFNEFTECPICRYLAGLQTGVYESTAQLANMWKSDRRFEPTMSSEERNDLYAKWLHCIAQVRLSNPKGAFLST